MLIRKSGKKSENLSTTTGKDFHVMRLDIRQLKSDIG